jgi:hypothetical protein
MPQRRPGVVTLIGVILLLQATLTLVGGVVVLALNTQQRIINETGLSSSELVTQGVISLIVGAIVLLVAVALLGGSRLARGLVAAVQVITVAFAAYSMFAHHTGAFLFAAVLQVAISLFVLWALFNEKSDEYFAGQ